MNPNKFSQQQQQQVTNHKLRIDGGKVKMSEIHPTSLSKGLEAPKNNKVFLSHSPISGGGTPPHTSRKGNEEQEDFRRQMASLQERQMAVRQRPQRQKKSELLKEGGTVSKMIGSFQPASFSVEKSTADLLQETVVQMQEMTGMGQAAPSMDSLPTPIRSNQSWAAVRVQPKSTNPFAALDLDENEWDSMGDTAAGTATGTTTIGGISSSSSSSTPTIQLAPASFILLPRTTPTPATTPLREAVRASESRIPSLESVGLSVLRGKSPLGNDNDDDDDDIDPDL